MNNRRNKIWYLPFSLFITTLLLTNLNGCTKSGESGDDSVYGVFLGINRDEIEKLEDYEIVVIEPSEFSKEDIALLQQNGTQIYGYLNVGAVEEYRPYFSQFENLTLAVYDEWPDERWVDVSNAEWQNWVISELGGSYAALGLDGFFLDNCDVYYEYPDEDMYQGLCRIMEGLQEYNLTMIINGGDTFVSRCMEEDCVFFDGVNQETVFTSIHFDDESFGVQDREDTEYFKDYLQQVKEAGLQVYLLEYGADSDLSEKIGDYCKKNGFYWYNATSLDLT